MAVRWALLVLIVVLLSAYVHGRQGGGLIIAVGRVNPTEMEAQGCYFPIGQAASVNLHPEGDPCQWMRRHVGKTGILFFVPDE